MPSNPFLPLASPLRAACLATALGTTFLHAQAAGPQPGQPAAADYARPDRSRVASEPALREYLRFKDETRGTHMARKANAFCFVQQSPDPAAGTDPSVWMVWREGGELVNTGWHVYSPKGLNAEDARADGESLGRMKSIQLASDVRETAQEIAGSSVLVERAWVDRLLDQCRAKGRTVHIRPGR
jgi:hypothetical protein